MDKSVEEQTLQHLWNIGQHMAELIPAASRYYMFNLKRHFSNESSPRMPKELKSNKLCRHCGSLWTQSNHRVKIQPVRPQNKHIKKLLKWESEEPWKLNNRQKKKLKMFKEATSKIVYTCLSCKKTIQLPGMKRKFQNNYNKRSSLYTLPSNAKRKKVDLNAGLFIAAKPSTQKKIEKVKDTIEKLQNNNQDSSSLLYIKSKLPLLKKELFSKVNSQHSTKMSSLPKNTSRRKKSLLAEILKQEQETKKKKSSLSSFLVSF